SAQRRWDEPIRTTLCASTFRRARPHSASLSSTEGVNPRWRQPTSQAPSSPMLAASASDQVRAQGPAGARSRLELEVDERIVTPRREGDRDQAGGQEQGVEPAGQTLPSLLEALVSEHAVQH